MKSHTIYIKLLLLTGLLVMSGIIKAADLSFEVKNTSGYMIEDAIYFANTKLTDNVTITFASEVKEVNIATALGIFNTRTGSLIIDGGSKVTFKASGTGYRCINKASDYALTLKGITFNGFNSAESGSVIYNLYGYLTLDNVAFTENTTSGSYGFFFADSGLITITNDVRFENNISGNILMSSGIAMKYGSTGRIINITNNQAPGGVYWNASGNNTYNILDEIPVINCYIVTSGEDSGTGTLRQAVSDILSIGQPGVNVIIFNNEVKKVILTDALPSIGNVVNRTITIDGGTTGITIESSGAGYPCISKSGSDELIIKNITVSDFSSSSSPVFNLAYGYLTLDNVSFINNKSDAYGGIVNAFNIPYVSLKNNIVFDGNSAQNGVVLYLPSSGQGITDGYIVFKNNTGVSYDGADISTWSGLNTPPTGYNYLVTTDSDSGFGSLREAITYANNNPDIDYSITFHDLIDEVKVSSGWGDGFGRAFLLPDRSTGKDLTIDGKCRVTIRNIIADLQCFQNEIYSATLYLKGLTIKDFKTGYNGAAIYTGKYDESNNYIVKLSLENVNFLNNTCTKTSNNNYDGGGGAIYGYKSDISMSGRVYFDNNKAVTDDNSDGGRGGAIQMYYGSLVLGANAQVIFFNNAAYKGGGAYYGNETSLNVSAGGAIPVFTANKVLAKQITDNELTGTGGAILHNSENKTLNLIDAVFNSNEATFGGAIYSNTGLEIGNSSFSGNSALKGTQKQNNVDVEVGHGGAIYSLKPIIFSDKNNIFSDNKAHHSGGAIYYTHTDALNISGTFKGNVAGNSGGAVLVNESSEVTVTNEGVYNNNKATMGCGGFLCAINTPVTVNSGNYFRNNQAGYAGGAIYCFSDDVTVKGSQFLNNKQEMPLDKDTLEIDEGYGGGAIAVCGSEGEQGKASKLTLTGCYFENNKATKGGAVTSMLEGDIIEIDNATITDNTALTRFYNNLASIKIWDENKKNKLEFGWGGAVFAKGLLTVTAGKIPNDLPDKSAFPQFYNNRAGSYGGGIYCEGILNVTKVAFRNNTSYSGGGLYLRLKENENATITESRFRGNSGGWGGAISMENLDDNLKNISTGNMYSYKTKYYNNGAASGGAIYAQLPGLTDIANCLFEGNTAKGDSIGVEGNPKRGGSGGAIYSIGGEFKIGVNDIVSGNENDYPSNNIFRNNSAFNGNGMGGAICTSGAATITGALFDSNAAGYVKKKGEGESAVYEAISGHVIAFGNNNIALVEKVYKNTINNSKGNIPNPWIKGQTIPIVSNGIGYHNGYSYAYPADKSKWIIGNSEISENEISGNNYGVVIDPYVVGTSISKNTFTKNVRAIYTGQHIPRLSANDELMEEYGNQGLGMPLIYSKTLNGTTLEFEAALPPGLTADASLELYNSDTETDNNSTITYLGSVKLGDAGVTVTGGFPTTCGSTIKASVNEVATINNLLALSIVPVTKINNKDVTGSGNNTSELIGQAIKLQLNITDQINDPAKGNTPTPSGINWDEALFIGTFDEAGSYGNISSNAFTTYPGCETMIKIDDKTFSQTIYVNPKDTTAWKIGVQTADGKRYGVWSFNGLSGDTINLETYRVVQNYTFDNNNPSKGYVNDYKLLAVVDGTDTNPLRNNTYLSEGNASSTEGGGGGLRIKKYTPAEGEGSTPAKETIYLKSDITPIGSETAGKLSVGFIVIDANADFIVDGENAVLDITAHNGNSIEHGSRLIIEKEPDACGIFSLDNESMLITDEYFMSLYHHLMTYPNWSWLGHPEGVTFKSYVLSGGPVKDDKLLFSASNSTNQFTPYQSGNYTAIQIQNYSESTRATEKPDFTSSTAWGRDANSVTGFIATPYSPTAKDLYLRINEPETVFSNTPKSVTLSWTKCTRNDQYTFARAYLGNTATDAMVNNLVASYHSGWNLIGNPYSKPYEPDGDMGVVAMPDGNGNYIYQNMSGITLNTDIKNNTGSEFPGANDGNFRIPPLTAFFVQAKPNDSYTSYMPQINVSGSLSSLDNSSRLKLSQVETSMIRIDLMQGEKRMGQTVLAFHEDATPVADWGLDAPLMAMTGTDIYLPDGTGKAMAINVIGNEPDNFAAPIGLNINQAGNYTIRISEIKNIHNELMLSDNGNITSISEGGTYLIYLDKGISENRLTIASSKTPTNNDQPSHSDPIVYAANQKITICNLSGKSRISLIDSTGHLLKQVEHEEDTYIFNNIIPGYYIIKVTQENNQIQTLKTTLLK